MIVVFTDCDGTLLDHDSYSYAGSLEGMELLRRKGVPLILVSSKTLPEMAALRAELGLPYPFVFENGGGIAWPEGEGADPPFRAEILGPDVRALREKAQLLEEVLGRAVRTILDMEPREIAEKTGLPPERAAMARQRKASLPFLLPGGGPLSPEEMESVNGRLAAHGLMVTKGGRFYHLLAKNAHKGEAVRRVMEYLKVRFGADEMFSVGIGDSENDIPLLRAVDRPVLVRKHSGEAVAAGDEVTVTEEAGPAGFTEAMKKIFGV